MDWQPIDTAPESVPVLVWAERLHRGLPSAEVVVVYRNGGDDLDGFSYWTNGGANAGDPIDHSYWDGYPPTHWAPLQPPHIKTPSPTAE